MAIQNRDTLVSASGELKSYGTAPSSCSYYEGRRSLCGGIHDGQEWPLKWLRSSRLGKAKDGYVQKINDCTACNNNVSSMGEND